MKRREIGTGVLAVTLARGVPAMAQPRPPPDAGAGFPAPVTALWTGSHSHWMQPWRPMLATRTIDEIRNGLGIQNNDVDHPDSLAMFAAIGFRHTRMGVNWSFVSMREPDLVTHDDAIATTIRYARAARAAGLRPIVVLQAFSQAPCPHETRTIVLAEAANAGDRTLTLETVDGMVPGHSGLTAWWQTGGSVMVANYITPGRLMGAVLFTGFNGRVAHLSRPMPVAIEAGSRLVIDTLAHAPFGRPETAAYADTMRGWHAYVGAVGRFMQGVLGTANAADRGYDLEIWNEVTFGSEFLDINNYYDPPPGPAAQENGGPAITPARGRAPAAGGEAGGDLFRGGRGADGFASVTPQPAASREPPRVSALTKHPYPTPQSYPAADNGQGGLDRFGQPTRFVPRYTMYAHEWFSTAISPFTLARDIATTPNNFGGVMHGTDARTVDGVVSPVTVWMTEIGTAANVVGVTDPARRMRLLAKGTLRALFFNLGIGVERVYLFRGVGGLDFFALVPPEAPTTPTLPLVALRRALDAMRPAPGEGSPAKRHFAHTLAFRDGATPTRLFAGNGTPGCPDMVRGDDLVVVPVAIGERRTAFIAWFIGLDMRDTMPPVSVTLRLTGLGRTISGVTVLDPIAGRASAAAHAVDADGALSIDTEIDDVPRILVVTETG